MSKQEASDVIRQYLPPDLASAVMDAFSQDEQELRRTMEIMQKELHSLRNWKNDWMPVMMEWSRSH